MNPHQPRVQGPHKRGDNHLSKGENLKFIGAYVDKDVYDRIQTHARAKHRSARSISAWLREAAIEYLNSGVVL